MQLVSTLSVGYDESTARLRLEGEFCVERGAHIKLNVDDLASGTSCARTFHVPFSKEETVDSAGNVGLYSSLGIASDGTVWVSDISYDGMYGTLNIVSLVSPVLSVSNTADTPQQGFCIPSPSHSSAHARAVPILLRLGGSACTEVTFGLRWDPPVAVLDPKTPVTFGVSPSLENLRQADGPADECANSLRCRLYALTLALREDHAHHDGTPISAEKASAYPFLARI